MTCVLLYGPAGAAKSKIRPALEKFHPELVAGMNAQRTFIYKAWLKPGEVAGVDAMRATGNTLREMKATIPNFLLLKAGRSNHYEGFDLEWLKRMAEDPKAVGIFRVSTEGAEAISRHPYVSGLQGLNIIFLSPFSRQELIDLRARGGMPLVDQQIAFATIGNISKSVVDKFGYTARAKELITNSAKRAIAVMRTGHFARYVMPLKEGTLDPVWAADTLTGSAERVVNSIALILKGQAPDYYDEKWDEDLLAYKDPT